MGFTIESGGSAGGPDAKVASACWSDATDWIAVGIGGSKVCSRWVGLGVIADNINPDRSLPGTATGL